MSEIRLLLDREYPDHERLASTIRKNLQELESVEVREIAEPVAPGTLSVPWHEIIGFVVVHKEVILGKLAAALVELAKAALAYRLAQAKNEKQKPIVIVVNERQLALPASDQKVKAFLSSLNDETSSKKKVPSKPRPNGSQKTAPKKTGRSVKRK
jgi:hypothetical protein